MLVIREVKKNPEKQMLPPVTKMPISKNSGGLIKDNVGPPSAPGEVPMVAIAVSKGILSSASSANLAIFPPYRIRRNLTFNQFFVEYTCVW